MIGLKDGRAAVDLAKMMDIANENADISHFVEVLPSGNHLIWGLGISAALVVIATLMKSACFLLSLTKKTPQE